MNAQETLRATLKDAQANLSTFSRTLEQQPSVRTPLASINRIRCFVNRDYGRAIPRIEGVDYTHEAEDDFDIFVAQDLHDHSFAEFLARCGNPAAPMIAFSDRPHPRADVVVKDHGSASFAAAVSSLQPLLKRTAALPPLPLGIDRSGLLALALMYTRNCSMTAAWQPHDPALVEYPRLRGIDNARSVLEEMAEAGLIRRRFYQRVHVCSSCGSSRLHAREVCLSCHSSQLVERPLIHHYSCAFQGPQPLFETADGYVCPKCRKQLRHYGVDYDKPGSVVSCADCQATLSEPEVGFTCVDCSVYTSGDQAGHCDWYHYDLLPDGVAALRSGELPHAGAPEPHLRTHSFRDFRLLAERLIAIAQRQGHPLTICQVRLDAEKLIAQVGQRYFLEICRFVRDLITENLREIDFVSSMPNGTFLCCLPEADRRLAESGCCHLQTVIGRSVRVPLGSSFEIIERDEAKEFLRGLGHV